MNEKGVIDAASAWATALEAVAQAEEERRLGPADQVEHAEANLADAESELYAAVLKWRSAAGAA
ncbi:MAG TPA: hypothetical protein VKZ79_09265 [Alphaproteobacteria bacterium]|nr:hypothetical protein [Alphaproteobacteria bacterium]